MSKKKMEGKEILLVVYNSEDVEGASRALLKADIPFEHRRIGSGDHGNFLMSLNNYGEEFFVAAGDLDRAKAVLEEWRSEKRELQKQEKLQEISRELTMEEKAQQRTSLYARVFAGILLAILVVVYLWFQN